MQTRGAVVVPAGTWLSQLLAGRAARAGRLWVEVLRGAGAPPETIPPPDQAACLVEATAAALAGGELTPLAIAAAATDPARPGSFESRADHLRRWLDALADAAVHLAAESAGQPPGAELWHACATAVVELERRLATHVAIELGRRMAMAEAMVESATTSVSVTVHELRRPLTMLSSYAQLLSAGVLGELPESAKGAVRTMEAGSETMMRLTESLVEVAQLELGEGIPKREVRVADLAATAVAEVLTEAELRSVRLVTEVPDDLRATVEPERIVLALTNLLSNAIKHSNEGQPVTLRAESRDGAVHLAVLDEGPGFSEDRAMLLFDKYYRTPEDRETGLPGSGLGLFIVRSVAERHGGRASAEVRPEGGARFELVLPR